MKRRTERSPAHPGMANPAGRQDPLEQQIRTFVKNIAGQTPLYSVRVERAGQGDAFWAEHEGARCFLNSVYDVRREAAAILRDADREANFVILFGFGDGKILAYVAEYFPNLERVYVVEPTTSILMATLRGDAVLDRLRKVPAVTFIWNRRWEEAARELIGLINTNLRKKFAMAFLPSYRSLFKGYYERLSQSIIDHMRQTAVNIRSVEANIFVKTKNIISNLRAKSLDIDAILKRMRGLPAIMVAAGPSLNKNIHLLEAAKKKAFVIAVGSAIKILHSNGVRPHLRAAFSPHPAEDNVFSGIEDFEGIPLLYSNTLYYPVAQKYNAPKIRMTLDNDAISRYFYTRAGQKHTLAGSGGTIANVTFSLLCRTGCSHIVFTGQDMALTGLKMYADGSWSDPAYTGKEEGLIKTRDIYGQELFTTPALYGLKAQFEAVIKQVPPGTIEFINATEGGMPIEGTAVLPLAEVLASLPDRDIQGLIDEAFQEQEEAAGAEAELTELLRKAREDMKRILEINRQRREALQQVKEKHNSMYWIKTALDAIEKEYDAELEKIDFYAQVIKPELASPFEVIRASNQYQGDDIKSKVEAQERILAGYCIRLEEYGNFFLGLLEEQIREPADNAGPEGK